MHINHLNTSERNTSIPFLQSKHLEERRDKSKNKDDFNYINYIYEVINYLSKAGIKSNKNVEEWLKREFHFHSDQGKLNIWQFNKEEDDVIEKKTSQNHAII